MRPVIVILLALLAGLAGPWAAAQERDDTDPYWRFRESNEYDESLRTPWQEQATDVPGLPADDDLSRVRLDGLPPGMTAYLHVPTLSVGDDHVLRYWLVIKGDGGGYNATFEGTRCAGKEYRVYAYGYPRRDPPVVKTGDAPWRSTEQPAYRRELTTDVFCLGTTPRTPRQVEILLRRGEQGGHGLEQHFQF